MDQPSPRDARSGSPNAFRVLALTSSQEASARIRGAVAAGTDVHFCESASQLGAVAVALQPSIIIIELVGGEGVVLAPNVKWLRTKFPTMPIIAYCALSGAATHDIVALTKAG